MYPTEGQWRHRSPQGHQGNTGDRGEGIEPGLALHDGHGVSCWWLFCFRIGGVAFKLQQALCGTAPQIQSGSGTTNSSKFRLSAPPPRFARSVVRAVVLPQTIEGNSYHFVILCFSETIVKSSLEAHTRTSCATSEIERHADHLSRSLVTCTREKPSCSLERDRARPGRTHGLLVFLAPCTREPCTLFSPRGRSTYSR